jgi:hypothetical protein
MRGANPREAIWAANGKAINMGLPKPVGAHIIPPCAMDARNGGFQS